MSQACGISAFLFGRLYANIAALPPFTFARFRFFTVVGRRAWFACWILRSSFYRSPTELYLNSEVPLTPRDVLMFVSGYRFRLRSEKAGGAVGDGAICTSSFWRCSTDLLTREVFSGFSISLSPLLVRLSIPSLKDICFYSYGWKRALWTAVNMECAALSFKSVVDYCPFFRWTDALRHCKIV